MSTNQLVQGVKIYLPEVATQDLTIGLYTAGGESEFRWIENTLAGLVETWKTGMLAENGIPEVEESAEWKHGANVAQVKPMTISVDDTSQLWKTLDDAGVSLNGCKCEIIEFTKVVLTSNITEKIIYRGKTDVDKWNRTTYTIPTEPAHLKRVSNILTQVDDQDFPNASGDIINDVIPASFGEFSNDKYAKMIRVADKEEVNFLPSTGTSFFLSDNIEMVIALAALKMFPVVGDDGDTPPLMYKIKINTGINWWQNGVLQTTGTLDLSYFENKYIKIVDGIGLDSYRMIASAQVDLDSDKTIIEITIANYFKDTLVGNVTATETDNSWVQFLDIAQDYMVDVWPVSYTHLTLPTILLV